MDVALFLLLALLIIAIAVAAILLRRWVTRGSAAAGDRAGRRFTAEKVAEITVELGTTQTVHAADAVVRAILSEAIDTPRGEYSALDDVSYGIRFVAPDDTVVRLTGGADGTLISVESFREYMGFPQTAPLWTELRARIADAAAKRGVTVSGGPPVAYVRGPLLDDRNARWVKEG